MSNNNSISIENNNYVTFLPTFTDSFKAFFHYFIRYRTDNFYRNMNGGNIGGFKRTNNWNVLNERIMGMELTPATFTSFLTELIKTAIPLVKADPKSIVDSMSFQFIKDCLNEEFLFCSKESNAFNEDDIEQYNLFLEIANSLYNSQDENDSLSDEQFEQIFNQLGNRTEDFQSTVQNITSSNNKTMVDTLLNDDRFTNFFKNIHEKLNSTISSSIDNKIKIGIDKYLGERDLCSDQIEEYKKRYEFTLEKILKKENDILIMRTHIKNETIPSELGHLRHPKPFLPHDEIFIDKYNDLISNFQKNVLALSIERLEEQVEILRNDLKIFKNILSKYISSIENFANHYNQKVSKNLEKEFIKSNDKCLKVALNKYKVTTRYSPENKENDNVNKQKRLNQLDQNRKKLTIQNTTNIQKGSNSNFNRNSNPQKDQSIKNQHNSRNQNVNNKQRNQSQNFRINNQQNQNLKYNNPVFENRMRRKKKD